MASKDQEVLVDDEDYPLLSRIKWYIDGRGYATSRGLKGLKMHQLVMGHNAYKYELQIDHVDGNRLNNTKNNLRFVTNKINAENLHKKKGKNPTSRYIGVTLDKRENLTKRWTVYIKNSYQSIFLGRFKTEKEAAEAYNAGAEKLGYLTRNYIE